MAAPLTQSFALREPGFIACDSLNDIFSGFTVDYGSTVGPLSHSCHSWPSPIMADPQPLPGTDKQERDLRRESVPVATLQVHEGQVWTH